MATPPTNLRALAETDVLTQISPASLLAALGAAPFVHAQGTFNTRDLGALPTPPSRGAFRRRLAFRSGALDGLTATGRQTLAADLGVRHIFDLRSQREHAAKPDPAIDGIEGTWVPTDEVDALVDLADFVDGVGEAGYVKMYLDVLRVYARSIAAVLEHVRDRPGEPFLFHCTAGRDRTGVVAGILLDLAGESPEAVALDFMLSRIGTEPAREQLVAFARHGTGVQSDDEPGFYNLCSLKAECWDAFISAVEKDYGGFEGYVLNTLGFSEGDLATIKQNLRQEDS